MPAPDVDGLAPRGEENEGQHRPGRVLAHLLVELIPIHLAHHDVGDHQIGGLPTHGLKRLSPICGCNNIVTVQSQQIGYPFKDSQVIIYQ